MTRRGSRRARGRCVSPRAGGLALAVAPSRVAVAALLTGLIVTGALALTSAGRVQPQRATAAESPRARAEPRAGGDRPLDPDAAGVGRRAGRRDWRQRAEISRVHRLPTWALAASSPRCRCGRWEHRTSRRARCSAARRRSRRCRTGPSAFFTHSTRPGVEPHGLPRLAASGLGFEFSAPGRAHGLRGLCRKPAPAGQALETWRRTRRSPTSTTRCISGHSERTASCW